MHGRSLVSAAVGQRNATIVAADTLSKEILTLELGR